MIFHCASLTDVCVLGAFCARLRIVLATFKGQTTDFIFTMVVTVYLECVSPWESLRAPANLPACPHSQTRAVCIGWQMS